MPEGLLDCQHANVASIRAIYTDILSANHHTYGLLIDVGKDAELLKLVDKVAEGEASRREAV